MTRNELGPFVDKYYLPYFKGATLYNDKKYTISRLNGKVLYDELILKNNSKIIILSNGMFITFFWNTSSTLYQWIFVDINGIQKPNRIGRDVFVMEGLKSKSIKFYGAGNSVATLKNHGNNISDDDAESNRDGAGCSKNNKNGYYSGFFCGALIEVFGWKISDDDYPW